MNQSPLNYVTAKKSPFHLFRSTREDFILALEALACAIISNEEIMAINMCGHDFKASLYADEMLLALSIPASSILHPLNIIKVF